MGVLSAKYFVGLDLGQRKDPTALVAGMRRAMTPVRARLEIQHAERFPLGLDYTEVGERVRRMVEKIEASGERVRLAVDASGPGMPVVDMMHKMGLRGLIWPVVMVARGGRGGSIPDGMAGVSGSRGTTVFTVNKTALFTDLRVGMEQGKTVLVEGMLGMKELQEELNRIGSRMTHEGLRVEGATEGHDDLAVAAALAQWGAKRLHTQW